MSRITPYTVQLFIVFFFSSPLPIETGENFRRGKLKYIILVSIRSVWVQMQGRQVAHRYMDSWTVPRGIAWVLTFWWRSPSFWTLNTET